MKARKFEEEEEEEEEEKKQLQKEDVGKVQRQKILNLKKCRIPFHIMYCFSLVLQKR